MKKITKALLFVLGLVFIPAIASATVFTTPQMVSSGPYTSGGVPYINGTHFNASSNFTWDDAIQKISIGDAGTANIRFNSGTGYLEVNNNFPTGGINLVTDSSIGSISASGNSVTLTGNNVHLVGESFAEQSGFPTNVLSAPATGYVGVATSTPWRTLSVNGSSDLGTNALAGYFTATTSTVSQFPYASTTMVSATTASTTNQYVSSLGRAAGTFVAADAQGKLIATTTPSGGGGVPYTGATGDVDLGSHILSTEILRTTGVQGAQLWNNGSFNFFSDNGITQTGSVDAAVGLGKYEFAGSSAYGVFDFNSITGSDKTYTFPDASGGIVLTNGGTAGMLSAWTSSSALTATSTPTVRSIFATSTTATSTFLGTVSVGTASPNVTSKFLVSNDGTFPSIYVNKQYGWTGFNATTTAGCIDCTFIVGNSPLPGAQSGGRSVVAGFRLDATLYAKQSWSIDEGPADHRKFQEYAGPSGQWHLGVLNDAETQEGLIFDVQTGTDGVGDATVGTVTIGGGEQDLRGDTYVTGLLSNNQFVSPATGEIKLGDIYQSDTCRTFGYDEFTGVAEFYPGVGGDPCSGQTNSLGINVTPDSTLDVSGTVRFEGASAFTTSSISGAITGIGCDKGDTTGLTGLASTTVFVTTPQVFPGNGVFFYTLALTSTSARTYVCSDVTVTPTASTYNVRIIR